MYTIVGGWLHRKKIRLVCIIHKIEDIVAIWYFSLASLISTLCHPETWGNSVMRRHHRSHTVCVGICVDISSGGTSVLTTKPNRRDYWSRKRGPHKHMTSTKIPRTYCGKEYQSRLYPSTWKNKEIPSCWAEPLGRFYLFGVLENYACRISWVL